MSSKWAPRGAVWRTGCALACLWVSGCVVSDTEYLKERQCRIDADCTLPGYLCERGYCMRLPDFCEVDEDCEDGFFCNGVASCNPGSSLADEDGCVVGAAPALNDGIPCTLDVCDEATRSVMHTQTQDCICDTPDDHAACERLAQARDQSCETARCNAELTCLLTGCESG